MTDQDGDPISRRDRAPEVLQYVRGLLGSALGATPDAARAFGDGDAQVHGLLTSFCDRDDAKTIYVSAITRDTQVDGYVLEERLDLALARRACLAIMRRSSLRLDLPIAMQLQVLTIPVLDTEADALSSMHSIVRNVVEPMYESALRRSTDQDGSGAAAEGKRGAQDVRKRLNELQLTLQNLQNEVAVPRVELILHPAIAEMLDRAAREKVKPTVALLDATMLEDQLFLNSLQATVNVWRRQLTQTATKDRDPAGGSTAQEIKFWISLEDVLEDIESQLRSDGVRLTIDVLQAGKRFGAAVAIDNDALFKDARRTVKDFSAMMKDIPLDDVQSAASFNDLATGVTNLMAALARRLRGVAYPVRRALTLLECVSSDVDYKVISMLQQSRQLLYVSFDEFEEAMLAATRVFDAWDDSLKDFTAVAREAIKRRGEKFLPIKVQGAHTQTQERLSYLYRFRRAQEALLTSLDSIFDDDDISQDCIDAFELFRGLDCLDQSVDGTRRWLEAEAQYNGSMQRIEDIVIDALRSELAEVDTLDRMFRVFGRFNTLFVRPRVRAAVQEYQTQLIDGVKADVAKLQRKYRSGYAQSDEHKQALLHDLPTISSTIIWARQITAQLDNAMIRVEAVLGTGWELYSDGQRLQSEVNSLRSRLDMRPVYDGWVRELQSRRVQVAGKILKFVRDRSREVAVQVNFDPRVVMLFKEVRNLQWLSFNIPHQIIMVAKAARRVYPMSIALTEALRDFAYICERIERNDSLSQLLAGRVTDAQHAITDAAGLRWENFVVHATLAEDGMETDAAYERVFSRITSAVEVLQQQLDVIAQIEQDIQTAMSSCASADLSSTITTVQSKVQKVAVEDIDNFEAWLERLNQMLGQVLARRLADVVQTWLAALDSSEKQVDIRILLRNQLINVEPPIADIRAMWWRDIEQAFGDIAALPRLSGRAGSSDANFSTVTDASGTLLSTVRKAIEARIGELDKYIGSWLRFQHLWDVQIENIVEKYGDNLADWLDLVEGLRKNRITFDTSESTHSIGSVLVHFEHVQSRVVTRYDAIQREIFGRLSLILAEKLSETYVVVQDRRLELEQHAVAGDVDRAVSAMAIVHASQIDLPIWKDTIGLCVQGQRIMTRHRLSLHNAPTASLVQSELESFEEILERADKKMSGQYAKLQSAISTRSRLLDDRVGQLLTSWSKEKPVRGELDPQSALQFLTEFEKSFATVNTDDEALRRARKAFKMTNGDDSGLQTATAELSDLRSVWSAILPVWQGLHDLRDTSIATLQPDRVKAALTTLLSSMQDMPGRVHQYAAFEHWLSVLQENLDVHHVVRDLKSDVFKERHWRTLVKDFSPARTTLGHVYDLRLRQNRQSIYKVISQAQGEYALESFLITTSETWASLKFETRQYKNRCHVIVEWDSLFAKCSENLSALQSMRHSPFYRLFRDDAQQWEAKLSRAYSIFDSWLELQKQWVYLEGTFSGNADIKRLLPKEAARFASVDVAFVQFMQRVRAQPLVSEVLAIDDIERTLERQCEQLTRVKQALGQYLDRERAAFPRFFFLGNEDLLEIIGDAGDHQRIARHLSKMYIGCHSLDIADGAVVAVVSKQGERLPIEKLVLQEKRPAVWLNELDGLVREALRADFEQCLLTAEKIFAGQSLTIDSIGHTVQAFVLALQVTFCKAVDATLSGPLRNLVSTLRRCLEELSAIVATDLTVLDRARCESVLVTLVHQESVIARLDDSETRAVDWSMTMRHSRTGKGEVSVHVADATQAYGFEYYGAVERLVQTDLTDRCYLTMMQALDRNLGGAPFGPAGTGKTETVKSLGLQLGRYVAVFCCDDAFDYTAVSRILLGLSQLGAWGCFDEFNRLESRILSAVSQQLQGIQQGLLEKAESIEMLSVQVPLHRSTAVFITTNPDYAGRSRLPDNLKRLFRGFAMSRPDLLDIVRVLLYSQGFALAQDLSSKLVPFFEACSSEMTAQKHYDFGLRALKAVLVTCGKLRRQSPGDELQLLVRSLQYAVAPKLVADDSRVFEQLVKTHFGKVAIDHPQTTLREHLRSFAAEQRLSGELWLEKAEQLDHLTSVHPGSILIGPAGSGKSTIWRALVSAYERSEGKSHVHVFDAKCLSKTTLYGKLDDATRHWTDGVLTSILRKIAEGGDTRHWIVFDGDIDPVWVENLNSLLDDNRMLSLPNGERIALSSKTRFLFEVENLDYATPATISRCGMLFIPAQHGDISAAVMRLWQRADLTDVASTMVEASTALLESMLPAIAKADQYLAAKHTMKLSSHAFIGTFVDLIVRETKHQATLDTFTDRALRQSFCQALIWSIAGDVEDDVRREIESDLLVGLDVPHPVLAYEGAQLLSSLVPRVELDPDSLSRADIVIPTTDTLMIEGILVKMLEARRPVLLCGPPGSGKTMLLLQALRRLPEYECVSINFSSRMTTRDIIVALEQHCTYEKTAFGLTLGSTKKVVLFCDEVNLPAKDEYGSLRPIALLRQLIEHGRFIRKDGVIVTLRDVQFVGACNPPTDVGRTVLPDRFLRHCTVLLVGHPSDESLTQIYSTFFRAALRTVPVLSHFADRITRASLDVYQACRHNYNAEKHAHYVYSPRELTRWVRGVATALSRLPHATDQDLAKVWTYEALRLFSDRLVTSAERDEVKAAIFSTAEMYLESPQGSLLYTDWLSRQTRFVEMDELHGFVSARLTTFAEEDTEQELFLHDDMLEEALKLDRVFHQPQGHMIMVGRPGSGRTTIARFVAWLGGLKTMRIRSYRGYTAADFDEDLRSVLRTCLSDRVCFILEEGSMLESAFIERINTLLANAEVPGLFEGEELVSLMAACRDRAAAEGEACDNQNEIMSWFSQQIVQNLHVVFTMSPPTDLAGAIARSPALFNRCVVSWTEDWSSRSCEQVAGALVATVDLSTTQGSMHDAVVASFCEIHRSTDQSPQALLSALRRFIQLYGERTLSIGKEQARIDDGLTCLADTAASVEQLKANLITIGQQMRQKEDEANGRLQEMVTLQREAEKRRTISLEIQAQLEEQDKVISNRRSKVLGDLAEAEPAVLDARESVSNIKKQQLTELRSMSNPPEAVKLAMEGVCTLLGHNPDSWRAVQGIVRREDFISSIVRFDGETQISAPLRAKMHQYLDMPMFQYDIVNRASKACGPMVQWVVAQIRYSEIVESVAPLRDEVDRLESEAVLNRNKLIAMAGMIEDVESNIATYKQDYARLISETQRIQQEMSKTQAKVSRSEALLQGLSKETDRWRSSLSTFELRRANLLGDVILSAAYQTYCLGLVEIERSDLADAWSQLLTCNGIGHDPDWSFVQQNSTLEQRMAWRLDALGTENAIGLTSDRTVMVSDPTGRALTFLQKGNVLTSFREATFAKTLESALRFGNTILIMDAEAYDPIVNALLNREYSRVGGRLLVQLGKRQIDVSPAFKMILYSRADPSAFSADRLSRVTLLHFALTLTSLRDRILAQIMQAQRPDVEKRRQELEIAQADLQSRLARNEDSLLDAITQSSNILEDDIVLQSLESLRIAAVDILSKIEAGAATMQQLRTAQDELAPAADLAVRLYDVLQQVADLHPLYTFTAQFLERVVASALSKDDLTKALLHDTLCRAAACVLSADQLTTTLALLQASGDYDNELKQMSNDPSSAEQTLRELISAQLGRDALDRSPLREHLGGPIILAAPIGQDPSYIIEGSHDVQAVPLGSKESLAQAERMLSAARDGSWLVIKNAHLAPEWLETLPQRLTGRVQLFLTVEATAQLPSSLLQSCTVLFIEAPVGMRASLLRSLSTLDEQPPAERRRVHVILAWLYAIVCERLRYGSLAWSKPYEFGASDLEFGKSAVDRHLAAVARGRGNVDPHDIPWQALARLMEDCVFGGVVDVPEDRTALKSFVRRLFTADSFERGFELAKGVSPPDSTRVEEIVAWADALPDREPTSWLALPDDADRQLATARAAKSLELVSQWQKVI